MFTHNFDPVLFNFGFFAIRWYSLAYIFGIFIGWWYGKKIILNRLRYESFNFDLKIFDDLITWLILSIIIGGRLGYVFFYNLEYFFINPLEIFKIWKGGMSFHGALIGIIIGTHIFAMKKKFLLYFF